MSLSPETQLGPYKIVSLIGAGGMGEVYRAHDARLRRDVALKVLPKSFITDAERLRRFEQEARAIAALNHPNVVSVYDIGHENGIHYIVSELLEGETLRERIPATGIPPRRAVELAIQFARGLAAAHEQGIVHRDLKPENVIVTKDGRLKILDFGLAKQSRPEALTETVDGLSALHTSAGQVMGTVGYMSPEQVRGDIADHRSDIFSFGSILYEMFTGQRAFKRDTGAETMTAVLKDDPPELSPNNGPLAPAIERIIRHCMEKQPNQRFQSAQDIAFDFESLSTLSGTAAVAPVSTKKSKARWLVIGGAAALLLIAGAALGGWLRPVPVELQPKLHRITFRRGTIWNARFAPEGNLIYGASWEGRPAELFVAQKGSTESRALGMTSMNILAIAGSGELAVSSNPRIVEGFEYAGMLGRTPQGGGAPRDVIEGAEYADWSPDGGALAVVRRAAGKIRLEYPLGKVLYETAGWISHPRISADGNSVAFIDHPYSRDDAGAVAVVDRDGKKKTLTGQFISAQGLAWWPQKKEVWFTATTSGSSRMLYAVTLDTKQRLVYLGTGTLTLYDISKDGMVLFARDDLRAGMVGLAPGQTKERDLSWHDWTIPRDISDDGTLVSFDETGEAGGETGAIYVRRTDGSPAVRLGDGASATLSPDGKMALVMMPGADNQRHLTLVPTGAGEPRRISTGEVRVHQAYFFPDGRRILELGSSSGGNGLRLWVQDGETGKPRPISPEGVDYRSRGCISPDGSRVVAVNPEGKIAIYLVDGGEPQSVPGTTDADRCVQWTPEGKSLLVTRVDVQDKIYKVDLPSGERKLFHTLVLLDQTGLQDSGAPNYSRDLKSYVYSYSRTTSDLYMVEGLR